MDKNRVVLNLAGQEFRISSASDAEYLRKLEAEVNSRIRKIQEQYPGESTSRCALLAMLNMSDEVIRLSEETNEFSLKLAELRSLRESGKDAVKAPVKRPFERARKPVGV